MNNIQVDQFDHLPKTADGVLAFNGMKVWECSPYSIDKVYGPYTINHIRGSDGDGPWFVLKESMYEDSCGCMMDGNTEHYSKMYADPEKARIVAEKKYEIYLKEMEKNPRRNAK